MGQTIPKMERVESDGLPKPDPELSDPIGFEMPMIGNVLWIVTFLIGVAALILSIWR